MQSYLRIAISCFLIVTLILAASIAPIQLASALTKDPKDMISSLFKDLLDGVVTSDINQSNSTISYSSHREVNLGKFSNDLEGPVENETKISEQGSFAGLIQYQESSTNDIPDTNATASENRAPVAIAEGVSTAREGQIVHLYGNRSYDDDGSVESFQWTQSSGDVVVLSDPMSASPIFTAPTISNENSSSAALSFQLIVKDNNNLSSEPAEVVIIVYKDRPPIANAGPDQEYDLEFAPAIITLNATASSDLDDEVLSYQWLQLSGPFDLPLQDANTATLSIMLPDISTAGPSVFSFQLIVSDGHLESSDEVLISFLDSNSSVSIRKDSKESTTILVEDTWIANAGPDVFVYAGSEVMLDGSQTTNPGGDPITYDWSQIGGPSVDISDSSGPSLAFIAPSIFFTDIVLEFQLTASDGTNTSTPDTVLVTVYADHPPVAFAGSDQIRTRGASVQLGDVYCYYWYDCINPSFDFEGNPVTYTWSQMAGPEVPLSDEHAARPTFIAPSVSSDTVLTFQLVVNDGRLDSDPDTVDITILANMPPYAFAGPDRNVASGSSVILQASTGVIGYSDPLNFTWNQIAGPEITMSDIHSTTASFTAPSVDSDTILTFQLIVSNELDVSASDSVDIRIIADEIPPNSPPTAIAGPDQVTVERQSVSLYGDLSFDVEGGSSLVYTWTQTAGPTVTLSNPHSPDVYFVAPSVASDTVLTFQLVVNDGTFDSAPDALNVKVKGSVPIADAGPDQTTGRNRNTILYGYGSNGINLSSAQISYSWTQTAGPTVTLSTPNSLNPAFTPPEVSVDTTLSFRLIVNDGVFESEPDSVDILVLGDSPPIVQTGNQVITPDTPTVTLSQSSFDPEGNSLSFFWIQRNGSAVLLSDNTATSPSFATPSVGSSDESLTFQVIASDGMLRSSNFVNVTINVNDTPPIADAASDRFATANSLVRLGDPNCSYISCPNASYDPDGYPLTFSWTQIAGPEVILSDPTSPQPTFVIPRVLEDTTLSFQLIVNDGVFDSEPDVENIIVPGNRGPTASGSDYYGLVGSNITIYASTEDLDADPLIYAWSQVSGPEVALSNSSAQYPSFIGPEVDADTILTFQLTVDDGLSQSSPATINITIRVNDEKPIAFAGFNQTVSHGQTVTIGCYYSSCYYGAGYDPDGYQISYTWSQIAGPEAALSDQHAPYPTFVAPNVDVDTELGFQLVVNDSAFDSEPATIYVTVLANRAPIAVADNERIVTEGRAVLVDGSFCYSWGSCDYSGDPDGDPITYSWTQIAGPEVLLEDSASFAFSFTAPSVDSDTFLSFQLIVSDGTLVSEPDTVDITVIPETAPQAIAGADQIVSPRALVRLSGSGTDRNDDVLSFSWTQLAGPSVTLSDASSTAPSFFAPNAIASDIVITFQLTVTDGVFESTDSIDIVVNVNDHVPFANAGVDRAAKTGSFVTLDASDSSDLDGDPLTYLWTQIDGTSVVLNGADSVNPTFVAPEIDATLVFSLTVADGVHDSLPDTIKIIVKAINNIPTANAGSDQLTFSGANVTLDGSASSDPDNDPLQYIWSQASGPSVVLLGPDTAKPSFLAPDSDTEVTLTFKLIVNDGISNSSPDFIDVRVQFNTRPTANAGDDQVSYTGEKVYLDGSVSSDPDGEELVYNWTQLTGPMVELENAYSVQPTFLAPAVDADTILTFQLIVNDGVSDSAPSTVNVKIKVNLHPPVADAGINQFVHTGELVTLHGNASDADASTDFSYLWVQLAGENVTLSDYHSSTPSFVIPDVPFGSTISFQLIVNDGRFDSLPDIVNIKLAPNLYPPVANAGIDQSVIGGQTVSLNGGNSYDPDGYKLVSFKWTQTSGPLVTLLDNNSTHPAFLAPLTDSNAAITFQLITSDGEFESAPSVVHVSINANGNPPLASPRSYYYVLTPGSPGIISGFDSYDPDGYPIVAFNWTQLSGPIVDLLGRDTAEATFVAPLVSHNTRLLFQLEVYDGIFWSDPSPITIEINTNEFAPVANAGKDQTSIIGAEVCLDGTASYDPDGYPLEYSWTQMSGPDVDLLRADTVFPCFVAPPELHDTRYTFQLVVDDGKFIAPPESVHVLIKANNHAPFADAGLSRNVSAAIGSTIQLSGIGSYDPDGYPLTYEWKIISGTIDLQNADTVNPSFKVPSFGSFVFQLVVRDGVLESEPSTVRVTTSSADRPMAFATVGTVGSGATVPTGATGLDGSSSHSYGVVRIMQYEWTQIDGPELALYDDDTANPYFYPIPVNSTTSATFQLIVIDSTFQKSDPAIVKVILRPLNITQPPIARAASNYDTAIAGQSVILDGLGSSDPAGFEIKSYLWTQTSGPTVYLSNANAQMTEFIVPKWSDDLDAIASFQLVVSNGKFESSPSVVNIQFKANNTPPVAVATIDNEIAIVGQLIALQGFSSYDPDGYPIKSYEWTQVSGPTVSLADFSSPTPRFVVSPLAKDTTLSFSLTVYDGQYSISSAVISVKVKGNSNPPIAQIEPIQNATEGSYVVLSGLGSYDPDGYPIKSYEWTQVSGPHIDLIDSSFGDPYFIVPMLAEDSLITFNLMVNDGTFDSAPTSTSFIVTRESQSRLILDIEDLDNIPVAGAKVILVDADTGDFIYGFKSGSSFPSAIVPRLEPGQLIRLNIDLLDLQYESPRDIIYNITEKGDNFAEVKLKHLPMARIFGKVVADDVDLTHAQISVMQQVDGRDWLFTNMTDNNGDYQIELLAGEGQVTAASSQGREYTTREPILVTIVQDEAKYLEIPLDRLEQISVYFDLFSKFRDEREFKKQIVESRTAFELHEVVTDARGIVNKGLVLTDYLGAPYAIDYPMQILGFPGEKISICINGEAREMPKDCQIATIDDDLTANTTFFLSQQGIVRGKIVDDLGNSVDSWSAIVYNIDANRTRIWNSDISSVNSSQLALSLVPGAYQIEFRSPSEADLDADGDRGSLFGEIAVVMNSDEIESLGDIILHRQLVFNHNGLHVFPQTTIPNGILTFEARYYQRAEFSVSNATMMIEVPSGASLLTESVVLNDTNYLPGKFVGSYYEIPIGTIMPGEIGTFRYQMKVDPDVDQSTIWFSSRIRYTNESSVDADATVNTEVFGVAQTFVKQLSMDAPAETSSLNMSVNGMALAGTSVQIYEDDIVLGIAKASAHGLWSADITLIDKGNFTSHRLHAGSMIGENQSIYSEPISVFYDPTIPEFVKFCFHDYSFADDCFDPRLGSRYLLVHESPFRTDFYFTNSERVRNVKLILNGDFENPIPAVLGSDGGYHAYFGAPMTFEASVVYDVLPTIPLDSVLDLPTDMAAEKEELYSKMPPELASYFRDAKLNITKQDAHNLSFVMTFPDGQNVTESIVISPDVLYTPTDHDLEVADSIGVDVYDISGSFHDDGNGTISGSFSIFIPYRIMPADMVRFIDTPGDLTAGAKTSIKWTVGSVIADLVGHKFAEQLGKLFGHGLGVIVDLAEIGHHVYETFHEAGECGLSDVSVQNALGAIAIGAILAIPSVVLMASGGAIALTIGALGSLATGTFTASMVQQEIHQLQTSRKCHPIHVQASLCGDPTGFVYEALTSNKLENVEVTSLIQDSNTSQWSEWDAKSFGQQNPQVTNVFGEYRYFAPEGYWQIKYHKDGYVDAESAIMKIPPSISGVNIGMVSLQPPKVIETSTFTGSDGSSVSDVTLKFDKYVQVSSIQDNAIMLVPSSNFSSIGNSSSISSNITKAITGKTVAIGADYDQNGVMLARAFRFVPESPVVLDEAYIITVNRSVKSYAGIPMTSDFFADVIASGSPHYTIGLIDNMTSQVVPPGSSIQSGDSIFVNLDTNDPLVTNMIVTVTGSKDLLPLLYQDSIPLNDGHSVSSMLNMTEVGNWTAHIQLVGIENDIIKTETIPFEVKGPDSTFVIGYGYIDPSSVALSSSKVNETRGFSIDNSQINGISLESIDSELESDSTIVANTLLYVSTPSGASDIGSQLGTDNVAEVYFDVHVVDVKGQINICIIHSGLDLNSKMFYYSPTDGLWKLASEIMLEGDKICGKIDGTMLTGTPIAVIVPPSTSSIIANAGDDQIVDEGSVVALIGSASGSPVNSLAYSWSQIAGPIVSLSDLHSIAPTFRAPTVNSDTILIFQLVVSDGLTDSEPDTVRINVKDRTDGDHQVPNHSGGGHGSTVVLTTETTFPESYFDLNPLSRVGLRSTAFVDMATGEGILQGKAGQRISISNELTNYEQITQHYAYIVEVTDNDGFAVNLGWQEGIIPSGQSTTVSNSWTPQNTGIYTIHIFVWDGVSDTPVPLSSSTVKSLKVT